MAKLGFLQFLFIYVIISPAYSQNPMHRIEDKNVSVEIIRYTIPADQTAAFEEAYAQAATLLKNSPYCLGYEIVHGVDEPQHHIVRIHWTSVEDHLNGFRKSKEFGAFFNLVKPFYNNIEEMKHYRQTPTTWTKE